MTRFCSLPSFLTSATLLGLSWLPSAHAELPGQTTFKSVCVACHGAAGQGVPGLAPALADALNAHLAGGDQAKTYFASVLAAGLSGPIESKGQKFNSAMPNLGLQDAQIAEVLNYVLLDLNHAPNSMALTEADVARARASGPTPAKTHAMRKALLAATGK